MKKHTARKDKVLNRSKVEAWSSLTPYDRESLAGQILEGYPLTEGERRAFVQSPKRVDKILGIEKYRDARIVARIVASEACIAGHRVGDRIVFDSAGRLLVKEADKPVCIRLLNRVWYRLIMILDRMADDTENAVGNGIFQGEVIEVRMNCYGAPFPHGDCGQVLMESSVEGLDRAHPHRPGRRDSRPRERGRASRRP